jgi:hypothetical protein
MVVLTATAVTSLLVERSSLDALASPSMNKNRGIRFESFRVNSLDQKFFESFGFPRGV